MRPTDSRLLVTLSTLALLAGTPMPLFAQAYDVALPPGENFETARFRLWHPDAPTLRGVVVLVPGSNGDGRGQVEDPDWRAFAERHDLALLGVQFTDRPHEQMFIEHYVDVDRGSGAALLESLERFAEGAARPELSRAPLFLWGMSAGGQFNYEFTMWKPERVAAFVVNKGGIYYTAQAPQAAQRVPGLFFVGETDLEYRNDVIAGIFAINRRAGALWALVVEAGVGHEVAGSKDASLRFFEEVLPRRLGGGPLHPLEFDTGFIADPRTREIVPAAEAPRTSYPTSWLPTEPLARTWREWTGGGRP